MSLTIQMQQLNSLLIFQLIKLKEEEAESLLTDFPFAQFPKQIFKSAFG